MTRTDRRIAVAGAVFGAIRRDGEPTKALAERIGWHRQAVARALRGGASLDQLCELAADHGLIGLAAAALLS